MTWKKATFVLPLVAALSSVLHAQDRIVPPPVPSDIQVLSGYKPFFRGHAVGTQNYICAPAATPSGVDWLFIGPQATLFDDEGEQVVTHFQSVNASDGGAIQA